MKISKKSREMFFDYVKYWYGKGEVTNHCTDKEINDGIDEYLEISDKKQWGDGDTVDRENVLLIMMSNRYVKIEKQIKKLKKELKKYQVYYEDKNKMVDRILKNSKIK